MPRGLRAVLFGVGAVWTLTLGTSLAYNVRAVERGVVEHARAEAAASFEKDLAYRRWAAEHGGVYVPVTPSTPPNPYLAHLPERDLVTPSGRALTLMNPAYMTRQVIDVAREQYGVRGHLTSLRPLRPDNAPDPWERGALEAFERGEREVVEVQPLDGAPYVRLMRPLFAEARCLSCHAQQGYRVGEVRGGLSVSVPIEQHARAGKARLPAVVGGHVAAWLAGLVGLVVTFGVVGAKERTREAMKARLRAVEERSRAILEGSPDAVFVVGDDARVAFANGPTTRLLGREPAAIVGQPLADVVGGELGALLGARVAEVARTGEAQGDEAPCEIAGRKRWLDVRLAALRGPADRVEGVLVIARDATTDRRLRDDLARAQRMETIGRLAGGVAHDFNNLLTAISGFGGLVLETLPEGDPRRDDLGEVLGAAARAKDLTGQLLAFARKQTVAPRVLDAHAAIRGVEKILRRLLGEQVELALELQAAHARIEVDPGQLDQVLVNIAVNARDAMPEGGRLVLRTRDDVAPDGARAIAIDLTDTGPGIAPDVVEHVFEPFFTTKGLARGTGLGLATCLGIVEQSGGDLTVRSAPGEGATFTIRLPIVDDPVEAEPAAPATSSAVASATVLVVEDEPPVRRAVVHALRRAGYTVLEAGAGAEAIEVSRAHLGAIDLVLTDVVMPGMAGPELAAELVRARPGLRTLFMSGYAADLGGRAALPAGATVVSKPFLPAELVAKVAAALGVVAREPSSKDAAES